MFKMKLIITEAQIYQLLGVYDRLMNSEHYDGVCNINIDYDEIMDRFVLNVFFNRSFIINLGSGGQQSRYIKKTFNEIGKKFLSFTNNNPLMYQHFSDC